MQVIEREIKERDSPPIPGVCGGITMQAAADALQQLVTSRPSFKDLMPEQCDFTQYNEDGFALVLPVEAQE